MPPLFPVLFIIEEKQLVFFIFGDLQGYKCDSWYIDPSRPLARLLNNSAKLQIRNDVTCMLHCLAQHCIKYCRRLHNKAVCMSAGSSLNLRLQGR